MSLKVLYSPALGKR